MNEELKNKADDLERKIEQFRAWLYEKPLPKSNGYQAEAEIRLKFAKVFGEKKIE